jgi:oligopeptide/dipeptide ABC transporter ATP-binding protein
VSRPPDELLAVEGLSKFFPVVRGVFGKTVGQVRAVDDVSFRLRRGETLGLVGESGCGKTTTGRSILRLIEPSAGRIWFGGTDLTELPQRELRAYRRRMQIVFQDPFGSLNPRMRVVDIIGEGIERHGLASGAGVEREVRALLGRVGLAGNSLHRYPHEFSGGQRQRIGIARAIAVRPDLIVCDEAVSALDVSIQAQVVNLLVDLRRELGLSYLFIAHDLSVVRHISDQVAVMYLGRIVEHSPCADLFEQPAHPYTRALLSAVPVPNPRERRRRVVLSGDVPTPLAPPSGCHFHPRCPAALGRCSEAPPPLVRLDGGRRTVLCVHAEGLEAEPSWYPELERRLRAAETDRAAQAGTRAPVHLARLDAAAGPRANVLRATPAAPLVPDSSATDESVAKGQRRGAALLTHLEALLAALVVAAGLALSCTGHAGYGLLLIAAGGVSLLVLASSVLAPRWLEHASRRLGWALTTFWLIAVLLSLWLVPLREAARARAELDWLRREIAAYESNVGRLPQSLADLRFRTVERYGMGAPRDPWGRVYQYQARAAQVTTGAARSMAYELWSEGPDGVPSADDVR